MLKKLLIGCFVFVVLGVAACGLMVYKFSDWVIKPAAESMCSAVLDTETTIGSISFVPPNVSVKEVRIANPTGYSEDLPFASIGMLGAVASPPEEKAHSILFIADSVTIDSLHLFYEVKKGKSNYTQIIENLERFSKSMEKEMDKQAQSESKNMNVQIKKLELTNLKLTGGSGQMRKTVSLPDMQFKDLGGKDAKFSDTVKLIFQKVLESAREKSVDAKNILPSLEDVKSKIGEQIDGIINKGNE